MAQSTSWNESSSTSTPTIVNNPASDWQLILSKLLGQLGSDQYQWALNQFAKLDSLTDTQIDNFLRLGDVGLQQAQGLFDRYEGTYAPLADQYAREAETYASPARIQHGMGRAQAHAMQAGQQGLMNAERELQSFGIDPSSGRYQDLIRASSTANAAAAAAAGEVERDRIEQTGRQMRENAMAYGQNLPAQSVNALNQAFQGVSGAINAGLGRANAGVNLTQSAAPYYNAAMGVRPPPVGQNTQSRGQGGSNSVSGGGGGSSRPQQPSRPTGGGPSTPGGVGGSYGGGRDVGPAYGAQQTSNPGVYRVGPSIQSVPGGGQDPWEGSPYPGTAMYTPEDWRIGGFNQQSDMMNWPGAGQGYGEQPDWNSLYQQEFGTQGYDSDAAWNSAIGNYNNYTDMTSDAWSGYQQTPEQWGTGADWDTSAWNDAYNWDAGSQSQPAWDEGQSNYYSDMTSDAWGGYQPNSWGTGADWDTSAWDNAYNWDSGGGGGGAYTQSYSPDSWGSGADWDTSAWDSGYNWAEGGPIPQPGGGRIPPSMSPSGGRQIDDVPATIAQTGGRAMLNSDEFVIPRDVALWKGQEFFQNMIKKSREARMGAPAKPSNKRPQGQNPGAGNAQRMA